MLSGTSVMETRKGPAVGVIVTIAVLGLLTIGAIALGVKFFNTSVDEEEQHKGWND